VTVDLKYQLAIFARKFCCLPSCHWPGDPGDGSAPTESSSWSILSK